MYACMFLCMFVYMYVCIYLCIPAASRGAAAQSMTIKPTGCGFDPHSRRWNFYLKFIFPFLRSGVEVKRGVEFCHLTRKASRIRQKVGNGVSYTKFPLPTLLWVGYSVKLIYFYIFMYSYVYKIKKSFIFNNIIFV